MFRRLQRAVRLDHNRALTAAWSDAFVGSTAVSLTALWANHSSDDVREVTMRRAMVGQCVFIALGLALVVSGVRSHAWLSVAVGAAGVAVFGSVLSVYAWHLLRHRAGSTVTGFERPDDVLRPDRARLVFFRTRDGGDFVRKYRLEVDGRKVGVLAAESSLAVDVEPGPHVCRARIDWTGSPATAVEPLAGQTLRVHVARRSRPSFGRQGWLVLDYDAGTSSGSTGRSPG
jgi:hypothetical protein